MAGTFYDDIGPLVDELLAEVGQQIALSVLPVATGFDDTTMRAVLPVAPAAVNMKGVVLDYTTKYIDGKNILEGDVLVYLSPRNVDVPTIKPDDILTVQGRKFKVVKAIPLTPAGTTLLWEIQARRP